MMCDDLYVRLMGDSGRSAAKPKQLNGIINQVVCTKHGVSVPADVLTAAATRPGMVLDYMTAYRALAHETCAARQATVKHFEMIIPFLEAMKRCKSDSVIGYTRDNDMHRVELYVFPGMMNRALKYIWPVVSLDAAHLRSTYKGTCMLHQLSWDAMMHSPSVSCYVLEMRTETRRKKCFVC